MNNPFINYLFRSVYILFGLAVLFGLIDIEPYESERANWNVRIAGGLILVLFGSYRIALYRIKSKKYQFEAEEEKLSTSYSESDNKNE